MRRRRSAWPWTWSSRFDLPVEDTEVTKVEKRAASFVPRQTQDKMQWATNVFDNGSWHGLSFSLLYLFTFLPFHRLHACVKWALYHVPIKRSTCTSALPLAMFIKNRHLGCNNKQAQHKKGRNHFFVQEITSPTSNRYIYFVSFIIENQPSIECVELQLPTVLQWLH